MPSVRVKVRVKARVRARVRVTSVAYCSGKLATKPAALDSVAAASTSSCVAPSRPIEMFQPIVPAKSTGSCDTSPNCERSQRRLSVLMSTPSRRIEPLCGS